MRLVAFILMLPVMAFAVGRGSLGPPPTLNASTAIVSSTDNQAVYAVSSRLFGVVGNNPLAEGNPSYTNINTSPFYVTLRNELYYRTDKSGYFNVFSNFVKSSFPSPRAAHPNWIWNTNSLLFRDGVMARGATAIGVAQELGATSTQLRFTLLTKRIATTSGHYFGTQPGTNRFEIIETRNQPVYFLTASNTLVTQYVARVYVWWDDMALGYPQGRDKAYLWFTNDTPDSITPMRIATDGTNYGSDAFYAKMGVIDTSGSLYASQDGLVLSPSQTVGIVSGSAYAGDSGSTSFFVGTNNEAIFIQTVSSAPTDAVTIQRIKTITATEGLDTNSYAPQTIDISTYP